MAKNKTGNAVPPLNVASAEGKSGEPEKAGRSKQVLQESPEFERRVEKMDTRGYDDRREGAYGGRVEEMVRRSGRAMVESYRGDTDRQMVGYSKNYDDSPTLRKTDVVTVKQSDFDRPRNYSTDDNLHYAERVVAYTRPALQESVYAGRYESRGDENWKAAPIEVSRIFFGDSDDEAPVTDAVKRSYVDRSMSQQVYNYHTTRFDSPRRGRRNREVEMLAQEQPRARAESLSNGRRMQAYVDERVYRDTYAEGSRRRQMPLTLYNERGEGERGMRYSTAEAPPRYEEEGHGRRTAGGGRMQGEYRSSTMPHGDPPHHAFSRWKDGTNRND